MAIVSFLFHSVPRSLTHFNGILLTVAMKVIEYKYTLSNISTKVLSVLATHLSLSRRYDANVVRWLIYNFQNF